MHAFVSIQWRQTGGSCYIKLILSPKRAIIHFLFLARKKRFSEFNTIKNFRFLLNFFVISILSMIMTSLCWKIWLGSVSFWLLIFHFRTYYMEKIESRADFFYFFFFSSKQMVLWFSKTGLFCFVFLAAEFSSEILRITQQREKVQVKFLSLLLVGFADY